MTQTKRKPMTQRERKARAAAKKELQEQGSFRRTRNG